MVDTTSASPSFRQSVESLTTNEAKLNAIEAKINELTTQKAETLAATDTLAIELENANLAFKLAQKETPPEQTKLIEQALTKLEKLDQLDQSTTAEAASTTASPLDDLAASATTGVESTTGQVIDSAIDKIETDAQKEGEAGFTARTAAWGAAIVGSVKAGNYLEALKTAFSPLTNGLRKLFGLKPDTSYVQKGTDFLREQGQKLQGTAGKVVKYFMGIVAGLGAGKVIGDVVEKAEAVKDKATDIAKQGQDALQDATSKAQELKDKAKDALNLDPDSTTPLDAADTAPDVAIDSEDATDTANQASESTTTTDPETTSDSLLPPALQQTLTQLKSWLTAIPASLGVLPADPDQAEAHLALQTFVTESDTALSDWQTAYTAAATDESLSESEKIDQLGTLTIQLAGFKQQFKDTAADLLQKLNLYSDGIREDITEARTVLLEKYEASSSFVGDILNGKTLDEALAGALYQIVRDQSLNGESIHLTDRQVKDIDRFLAALKSTGQFSGEQRRQILWLLAKQNLVQVADENGVPTLIMATKATGLSLATFGLSKIVASGLATVNFWAALIKETNNGDARDLDNLVKAYGTGLFPVFLFNLGQGAAARVFKGQSFSLVSTLGRSAAYFLTIPYDFAMALRNVPDNFRNTKGFLSLIKATLSGRLSKDGNYRYIVDKNGQQIARKLLHDSAVEFYDSASKSWAKPNAMTGWSGLGRAAQKAQNSVKNTSTTPENKKTPPPTEPDGSTPKKGKIPDGKTGKSQIEGQDRPPTEPDGSVRHQPQSPDEVLKNPKLSPKLKAFGASLRRNVTPSIAAYWVQRLSETSNPGEQEIGEMLGFMTTYFGGAVTADMLVGDKVKNPLLRLGLDAVVGAAVTFVGQDTVTAAVESVLPQFAGSTSLYDEVMTNVDQLFLQASVYKGLKSKSANRLGRVIAQKAAQAAAIQITEKTTKTALTKSGAKLVAKGAGTLLVNVVPYAGQGASVVLGLATVKDAYDIGYLVKNGYDIIQALNHRNQFAVTGFQLATPDDEAIWAKHLGSLNLTDAQVAEMSEEELFNIANQCKSKLTFSVTRDSLGGVERYTVKNGDPLAVTITGIDGQTLSAPEGTLADETIAAAADHAPTAEFNYDDLSPDQLTHLYQKVGDDLSAINDWTQLQLTPNSGTQITVSRGDLAGQALTLTRTGHDWSIAGVPGHSFNLVEAISMANLINKIRTIFASGDSQLSPESDTPFTFANGGSIAANVIAGPSASFTAKFRRYFDSTLGLISQDSSFYSWYKDILGLPPRDIIKALNAGQDLMR